MPRMNELTRVLVAGHLEAYFTNVYFKSQVDSFIAALPIIIEGFLQQAKLEEAHFKVRLMEEMKKPPKLVLDYSQVNLEGLKKFDGVTDVEEL